VELNRKNGFQLFNNRSKHQAALQMGLPLRVSILQQADRIVFVPVCFVLTRLRKLLPELPSDQRPKPKRIVIVKLAEQGSTVLATNALRRAVEMVGRENVYFAAFEENRFIVDVLELIPKRNVLTVPTTSVAATFFGTIRMLLRMRLLRIDAAVDLEFLARFSAAITYLSGARIRVGMHCYFGEGPYRGDLMTHRVLFNPQLHTSEMFQVMVEALEFAPKEFPALNLIVKIEAGDEAIFDPEPEEVREVEQILLSLTGTREIPPLILLNPNASDFLPLRRWPLNSYSELARELLARFPEVRIAFTGLATEAAPSAELIKQIGSARCFSMAGKTTLRQLLVLYTLARVLVTNDSGPAHFATLTPIQVVTLFGPESPKLFAARSPRTRVIYAGIACSPCINALNNRQSACRNNVCMQTIGVPEVLAAVSASYRKACERFPVRDLRASG
jgi:ADP-heptose:LPS heptosyltransferase